MEIESTDRETASDVVDRRIERWSAQLPGVDLEVEALVQRIQAISKHVLRNAEETLGEFGLDWPRWKVVSHLVCSGEPCCSTPGRLASDLDLSTGAMTNRLDRLEADGLVRRLPDPDDRRGVRVELTAAGRERYDAAISAMAEGEARLLGALDHDERRAANALLRRVLLAIEGPAPARPAG